MFSKMQLNCSSGKGAGEGPLPLNWAQAATEAHPNRKARKSRGMKVAVPPLDVPCTRPVTYQGDIFNYSGNRPKEETDWHSFPLTTRMSGDPYKSHWIVGGKIVQCPLAQSYQWRCSSNSPKSYQGCLTTRANTDVFLWPSSLSNFIDTGQDSMYSNLRLEDCCMSSQGDIEPPTKGMPQDSGPNSLLHFWPICMPDESFNFKTRPGFFGPCLFS
jgi:hypothetical protein